MRKTWLLAVVGVLALGALQAHALTIRPGDAVLSGNETSTSDILVVLNASSYGPLTELYKNDAGGTASGTESGTLAGHYSVTFSPAGDPVDALIQWDGSSIVDAPASLLVKDGNATPAWYFFDLTTLGWDGMEDLDLQDFWPRQGAISHVSLFGTGSDNPGGNPVPEPGTMLLLGSGLLGLAGVGRRKFKN